MIDGYSVQEAASVLGVPEGRVWELLARGVLSGTPEGDSMRVFLKAQAGPIATAGSAPSEEPPRTNGNGGSHGSSGEASAFRELLTEFRNLTERYGQALLALGEARGEVAGLRGRIDTLEARLDLRLPAPRDAEPVAWEAPVPSPAPKAASPAPKAAVRARKGRAPKPIRRAARSRKVETVEAAVAGFADALARAQDPAVADVGSSEETSEFEATPFLAEQLTEPLADEALPAEALPADPLPSAVEPPLVAEESDQPLAEEAFAVEIAPEVKAPPEAAPVTQYSADVVEPDWFADGDFAWLDVAEIEARTAPVSAKTPELEAEPELEPEPELQAEPELEADGGFEAEPALAEEAQVESEPEPEQEPELEQEPEPEQEPELEQEPEPEQEPMAAAVPEPPAEHEEVAEAEAFIVEEEAEAYTVEEAHAPAATAPPAEPGSDAGPELDADVAIEVEAEAAPAPAVPPQLPDEAAPPVPPRAAFEPSSEPDPGPGLEAVSMVEARAEVGPEPWAKPPEARGFSAKPPAGEEELMWLGDRRPAAEAVAPEMESTPGWRPGPVAAPPRWDPPAPSTWPEADRSAREEPRDLALSDDELARLARTEGWDATQVAAIRAMMRPSAARNFELPGADELDDAMAELQAPSASSAAGAPQRQWAKPPPERNEPVAREEWAYESEPAAPRSSAAEPNAPARRPPPDAAWPRSRRGPAATAYRRLRRLFPG